MTQAIDLRDAEYAAYVRELRRTSIRLLRRKAQNPTGEELFKVLYPLWSLLDGLIDEAVSPNPTKALLLSHFREVEDVNGFVAISSDYVIERKYSAALLAANKRVLFSSYFDELRSDSLVLMNALHIANYREAMIAVRCMLEDLYRHLYYKDNREDFLQIHEGSKSEYELELTPKFFRGYLERSTYMARLKGLMWPYSVGGKHVSGLVALNKELYAQASGHVHGASPASLGALTSNEDLQFNAKKAEMVLGYASLTVSLAVALLSAAHIDIFARFSEHRKQSVLAAFGPKRVEFRRALRV